MLFEEAVVAGPEDQAILKTRWKAMVIFFVFVSFSFCLVSLTLSSEKNTKEISNTSMVGLKAELARAQEQVRPF